MSQRRYTYLVKEDILLLKRRYTSFLKETHRTFAHSGMGGLLLWLLILTACVGEELQKPLLGEGEGYLRLQIAPVSAEITTSPLTKAEIATPDKNDLTINIKQGNTSVAGFPMLYAKLPDLLVLKVGTYTVEAYHGENNTLQKTPYFHKSTEVTIKANQNNDVKLIASLANAMLEPLVDANLAKHYSTWKLTASTSDKSYTFAEKDKPTTTLYAKAGETVTFTFSGKNLAEKEVSSSRDKTFDAGYAYQLQCNPNIDAFKSIKVNATAEHTYDGGYLTGTNIKSFSADWNGADKDAIDSWQVDVKYGETTIRTYTGASLDNMTCQNNDWPYIPQGCSLSASVTLKAGDVISNLTGDFTSWPAPDFKVSVSAQTSYSVYKNEGAAAANEKNGSSIFDITSSVSISQEILSKYPELLSNVTYSEDLNNATTSAKLGASASLSNLSWARHQLTASVTFDKTTKTTSSAYPCDVTGLPYNKDFRTDSSTDGWVFSGTSKYEKDWGIQFLYVYRTNGAKDYAKLFSPAVYCPDVNGIDVSYSFGAMFTNSGAYNRSLTIYSGMVGSTDTHSVANNDPISNEKSWGKKMYSFTHESIIHNQQRLSFYHDEYYPPGGWSFDGTEYWAYISKLDIIYR